MLQISLDREIKCYSRLHQLTTSSSADLLPKKLPPTIPHNFFVTSTTQPTPSGSHSHSLSDHLSSVALFPRIGQQPSLRSGLPTSSDRFHLKLPTITFKIRITLGFEVQEYSGNFCKSVTSDIDLPGCAVLYTTMYGQRRIRVINLSLTCTDNISSLCQSADLDAQFTCLLKSSNYMLCDIASEPQGCDWEVLR